MLINFHDEGYGRIVELLQPMMCDTLEQSGLEFEECINMRHWVTIADLLGALDYFESELPLCLFGFSPYKIGEIVDCQTQNHEMPGVEIHISRMLGFDFQGVPTHTATQTSPDQGVSVHIKFLQPKFSDRAEPDEFTCGLTVAELQMKISTFSAERRICVNIDGEQLEIIRVRQEPIDDRKSADQPAPVELEIADVWSERASEIFRYKSN